MKLEANSSPHPMPPLLYNDRPGSVATEDALDCYHRLKATPCFLEQINIPVLLQSIDVIATRGQW